MKLKVGLGIPYFGDNYLRKTLYDFVLPRMKNIYEWDQVIISDPATIPHTRGGARNWLVDKMDDMDVVVLCDADSFPEAASLGSAIDGAYLNSRLNFAFDRYRLLSANGTRMVMENQEGWEIHHQESGPGSLGGCFAIRPEDWWDAGGSPEFDGWGFEDVMFAVQARTILGPNIWHPGQLTCLFHPTECSIGSDLYNRNIGYCKTIEGMDGQPNKMMDFMLHSRLWPYLGGQ